MQLRILQYNFELSEAILEISKSYGGKKSNSPITLWESMTIVKLNVRNGHLMQ